MGIWLQIFAFIFQVSVVYTFVLVVWCYMSTRAPLRNSSVLEPERDVVGMQAGVLAIGAVHLAGNCECTAQATVHQ